ncbi:MAG TPA: Gfo/Idh/MocA family oxidoreductase [Solirubrobacteraceae bacterium]|nr:Gfo/Idh/MocA family oxidoreductase [Solirubrobacteraceae bacterium]
MTAQWGLLSTARINDAFLAGVAQSRESAVLAVAGRDRDRVRRYAAERGIERAYDSYEALLADPDVDAVYISLPNSLHLEWARRALQAGKHVLCEKPLSRRAADVRAAFDDAERHDRLLTEAFMWRHHPQTARLLELISSGAIGRLRVIQASFSFHYADPGDVRLSAGLEGGALMDVGCYCVSAVRLLAGEPELVSGTQVVGGDGVDVVFSGWLRFPGDVTAHFDSGLILDDRHCLEVVGEAGSLYVADPWHARTPGIELRRGRSTELIEVAPANSYGLEADNLAAAIRGDGSPLLGRDDAEGQAQVLEALYASADSGVPVAIPR